MQPFKNAMEVFQLLDKSNCRACGEKTCLAFSGAVFQGHRNLAECPSLDADILRRYSDETSGANTIDRNRDEYLESLKQEVAALDLPAAAPRVGGTFAGDRLTLKVLGKDFSVDTKGRLYTDIHINPWVVIPLLDHLLRGKGLDPEGNWVSFRELEGGKDRYALFQKRCEEPMKRVADIYTDLFDDMVHLFSGRQVEKQFRSDISVVLNPLPKVPIMVCYWMPEDGLASTLNVFFERTADQNMDIGSVFTLGAGLAQMFARLAERHGYPVT